MRIFSSAENCRRVARRMSFTICPFEDFTEFEQRAAYFDGDPIVATKKGVNILERGSQVHDTAEVPMLS
jgi:hypothetical protein